jgi:malate dehydrogenase (oxaloacetate-decarboxylating)(NADP+)
MQRRGYLTGRSSGWSIRTATFRPLLLELGEGDAMITGVTRPKRQSIGSAPRGSTPSKHDSFGSRVVGQSYTVFLATRR